MSTVNGFGCWSQFVFAVVRKFEFNFLNEVTLLFALFGKCIRAGRDAREA